MKTYPPDSIFVTGVARVSKEDAINAMYGTFTLSLVVDDKNGNHYQLQRQHDHE